MVQPRIFLHLGIPKAASTYLQLKVFPRLKGVTYYRKKYFKDFPRIVKNTSPDDGPLLFSSEMYNRLEKRAQNIAREFPHAGIILVLRRQDRWIKSKYKYYLWKNGDKDFRDFFDIYNDQGAWQQADLYYQPKIEALEKLFDKQPLILLLDELQKPEGRFLEKLQDYTGSELEKTPKDQKIKTAFSDRQLILLRAFNKAFPYKKPQNWPKFLKQLHMNFRQGVNYLVAFSAFLFPSSYFRHKVLVPEIDLEAIQETYAKDWNICWEKADNCAKKESSV
jgi:hypothetical protein